MHLETYELLSDGFTFKYVRDVRLMKADKRSANFQQIANIEKMNKEGSFICNGQILAIECGVRWYYYDVKTGYRVAKVMQDNGKEEDGHIQYCKVAYDYA